jgi:hypothetical protein
MSKQTYQRMAVTSYTNEKGKQTCYPNPDPNIAQDPWPLRPWASKLTKGGKAADKKLEHCERHDVIEKQLRLSEMMGVTTKRTVSQAQAMGYVSATEVCWFQI